MQKENINLVPCNKSPGFYIVPNNERFSVNCDGVVYDRLNDEIAINSIYQDKPNRSESTYISVYDYPVHRLMAETFLSKEHLPNNAIPIVNHKNGIKYDNKSSNLEWTTYQGNTIHAYKTGLRSDNIPILCKNIITEEIKRYYSYWDCARSFKTNGANIYHYLNRKIQNRLFFEKFILIREGEEWPLVIENNYDSFTSTLSKELFVVNKVTKETFIFRSATDASKHTGIGGSIISKKLSKAINVGLRSFDHSDWTVMLLKYATNWMKEGAVESKKPADVSVLKSRGKRKPKRVFVENLESRECLEYDSLEQFCGILKEKKNTVQKHILMNNGVWHGLFKIKYL